MRNRPAAEVTVELDVTVTLTMTLAEARDVHAQLGITTGHQADPTYRALDDALAQVPQIAR